MNIAKKILDLIARFIVFGAKGLRASRQFRQDERLRTLYNFKEKYCQVILPTGDLYHMDFDGNTRYIGHGMDFPVSGCPYPWKIGTWAYFLLFLYDHRRHAPAIAAAMILGLYFITVHVPIAVEILNTFVAIGLGGSIIIVIGKFAGPALVEIGEDYYAAKVAPKLGLQKALDSGSGIYRIGRDILVLSRPSDQDGDFESRVLSARITMEMEGCRMLVIPQRSPTLEIMSVTADGEVVGDIYHRDELPFDVRGRTLKGSAYVRETDEAYAMDVRLVRAGFEAWTYRQTDNADMSVDFDMGATARTVAFVCLSLLSVCLSAQPMSVQARTYLGSLADKAAPTLPIVFYFESAEVKGVGDGQKTWMSLLASAGRDTDNGRLQAIYAGDDKVIPAASATATQPAAPAPISAQPIPGQSGSMWDEFLPLTELPQLEKDLVNGIREQGRQIQPRQRFLGKVAWFIAIPIMFALFLLGWYAAKTAYHEIGKNYGRSKFLLWSMVQWGNGGRRLCFVVVVMTCGAWILNDTIYTYFNTDLTPGGIIWWMIKCLAKGYAGYWISTHAVPNPPTPGRGGGNGGGRDDADFGEQLRIQRPS